MRTAGNDDLGSTFQAAAVAVVLLFVTILILGALVGGLGDMLQDQRVDASGDTIDADLEDGSASLVDSTGYGLYHSHSMSSVDAETDGGVGDANSTVSVWAALDEDAPAGDNFHVVNLGDGVASIQFRSGEWYGYYNVSGGGLGTISAEASSPTELSHVALIADDDELRLVEDGQTVATEPIEAGATGGVPSARSWWGDQDELRVWSAPLAESDLDTLHDDPIMSVAHDDLEARLMMDEGSGDQTHVLVHGSEASLSGAVSWTDGLEGTTLVEGEDYVIGDDGTISIVEGSRLDALQVAYLTVDSTMDELQELVDVTGPALMLAGVIPLLLIVGWILRSMRNFGNNGNRI